MRTFLILLMIFSISCAPQGKKAIDKEEAIKLAEDFIAGQGYTEKKVELSKEEVVWEKDEYASEVKSLLNNRFNSLQAKAYGARRYGDNKWAVGFEMIPPENNIGRCVSIDSLGQQVLLQANQVRLDWLDEGE